MFSGMRFGMIVCSYGGAYNIGRRICFMKLVKRENLDAFILLVGYDSAFCTGKS